MAKLKITRTLTVTSEIYVTDKTYPGLSPEEAKQHELELDQMDQFEAMQFVFEESDTEVQTEVEIVE